MKLVQVSSASISNRSGVSDCSKPLVTLGICVRNCEGTIREVVRSILHQDFPHRLIEAVFVDDGSEDATLSVIQSFVSSMDFSGVRVFSGVWAGLGFARQTVVENAQGKYIAWIDGDMRLPKDYVRKHLEFIDKNPDVGIAKGAYGLNSNGSWVAFLEDIPFVTLLHKHKGEAINKLPGTGGAIHRLEAIKEVGGFDVGMKGAAEDVDLEQRIKDAGWLVYASPAMFYETRPQSWRVLWAKYYWYGYGMHYAMHRNRCIEKLYEMSPPAALLEGFLISLDAYRLVHKKSVFLLPLHFFFKMNAWFLGYVKSHMNSYGHPQ